MSDSVFKSPTYVKISGRSSSITNSFVQALIPIVPPSPEEVTEALSALGIDPENVCCAYCGDSKSEWDHLRPLVKDKEPTGFVTEIGNLVPACGKCNQSKGNKEWKQWMTSTAKLSPKTRGVADLQERIRRLEKFEKWSTPLQLNLEDIVGADRLGEYWRKRDTVIEMLKDCQKFAETLRSEILEAQGNAKV